MSTWRDSARPIIARVLSETAGKSEQEIRLALREAYPFGERKHFPYKIWLDEIAIQTGRKQVKQPGPPSPGTQVESCEGQLELF